MQIQNGKVPRARQLAGSGNGLSRAAQRRLDWMSYYRSHGNAALTCRHFDIFCCMSAIFASARTRITALVVLRDTRNDSNSPQDDRL